MLQNTSAQQSYNELVDNISSELFTSQILDSIMYSELLILTIKTLTQIRQNPQIQTLPTQPIYTQTGNSERESKVLEDREFSNIIDVRVSYATNSQKPSSTESKSEQIMKGKQNKRKRPRIQKPKIMSKNSESISYNSLSPNKPNLTEWKTSFKRKSSIFPKKFIYIEEEPKHKYSSDLDSKGVQELIEEYSSFLGLQRRKLINKKRKNPEPRMFNLEKFEQVLGFNVRGSFSRDDCPNKISVIARKDLRRYGKVEWKRRETGYAPKGKWYSIDKIKGSYPLLLIDFYEIAMHFSTNGALTILL